MGRVVWHKLALVTLPGLAIAIFALCWAVLGRLAGSIGTGSLIMVVLCRLGLVGAVCAFLLVVGAGLLGANKGMARFGIVYNLALIALLMGMSESLIPLPSPPAERQRLLLEQIRRRHEEVKATYRGSLLVPGKANGLGWLDRQHSFAVTGRRVLFIGDSMLEVRSRRRLALRVEDRLAGIEVINLSIASSDPLDYRFRLNEYAFDYHPSHIFIFLYGPNDFWLNQPYERYRSPPVRVNPQTVKTAEQVGLPKDVVEGLRALSQGGEIYTSRQAFLTAVAGSLTQEQGHLLYTLAVAHSNAIPRPFLGSTRERIENVGQKLVDLGTKALESVGLLGPAYQNWWNLGAFRDRHAAVYSLPREKRLRALADLFAEFMQQSPERVWQLLHSQSQELQSWLIAEPDVMWFLAIPLNRLAGLMPMPSPESPELRRMNAAKVDMYLKLLGEMKETAESHGCKLTYVFIPPPGLVDRDWNHFWGNLLPPDESVQVYREVLGQIPGKASFLDLGADRDRMRAAYWPFDGHWTDSGNDTVAEILVKFLRTQKP
ncbi:hypothetical protein IV102_18895 [bacterium]|nr:hypothetical protein [bacterium]